MARPISFFLKMRNRWLGNYQTRAEKIYAFLQETRKTKSWVQVDPPMHLSVKEGVSFIRTDRDI